MNIAMAWIEHDYPDIETLTATVTAVLLEACATALHERGQAILALAGGRTPLPIYHALSAAQMAWSGVVAMPTDDRCVGHQHPASNFGALRAALATADGMVVEALTSVDGDSVDSLLQARTMLDRYPGPFDIVLLGMGEDAHIASLFPGAAALPAAIATDADAGAFLLVPDPLPPEAPFPRVTLGLARMLRARSLHLVTTGARKREVLRLAKTAYAPLQRPVSALLHAPGCTTHIHWSP